MTQIKISIFFSVLFISGLFNIRAAEPATDTLSLIFAGDIMGHDTQINGAYNAETQSYDYEPTFRYIKPVIEDADIAIGNLEVTLAGPPYKGYPQFSSPDELAIAAKNAGFDILINANNHALDRGTQGFRRTLTVLDSLQFIQTGTFYDNVVRDKNYPLIIEKNSIRIALLNYTYGTNGLRIPAPSIVNRIDTDQIRKDLEKAALALPDYTIVTIHWGKEYEREENITQRKLARFMMAHGANAIIGSHPHVVQPVKAYYNNPEDSSDFNIVVYSLGNLVSNQRSRYRDGGILFKMVLEKTSAKTKIRNHGYLPAWVYREDLQEKSIFYIIPTSMYFNNEAFFNISDNDKYRINRFYRDTKQLLKNIPEDNYYLNYHPERIK